MSVSTGGMSELTGIRKRLSEALGDNSKIYFHHLRNWFSKKCTKEEFDLQARRMMTQDTVHLHNQFFLALLTKCQSLVSIATIPTPVKTEQRLEVGEASEISGERLKKGKIKKKSKSNKSSLEHRFLGFPASEMAPEVPEQVHPEERNLLFCRQEGTLPDIGLIHGRLMVSAWEEGMEGAEDQAVSLTLVAVQHFLKNIITAALTSRNPWRTREGAKHSIGCPIPDPWLQSTQTRRRGLATTSAATETTSLNEAGLAPALRPDVDKSEADAVYAAALGIKMMPAAREPFSLFDLLQVLKSDRSVISNHSVYSVNMERIIMRLHH